MSSELFTKTFQKTDVFCRQLLNDCGIGLAESTSDTNQPVVSQHRALVFCQLKSMLDIVERDLFKYVLRVAIFSGSLNAFFLRSAARIT